MCDRRINDRRKIYDLSRAIVCSTVSIVEKSTIPKPPKTIEWRFKKIIVPTMTDISIRTFSSKSCFLNWKRSWITATKSVTSLTVLPWTENMFAWNIVTNKWFINVTTCHWKIRLLKKPTFFSICSFWRWFLIFIFLVIH